MPEHCLLSHEDKTKQDMALKDIANVANGKNLSLGNVDEIRASVYSWYVVYYS